MKHTLVLIPLLMTLAFIVLLCSSQVALTAITLFAFFLYGCFAALEIHHSD